MVEKDRKSSEKGQIRIAPVKSFIKNAQHRTQNAFKNYGLRINYTWEHKKAFLKTEKQLTGNSLNGCSS